MRCRNLVAHGQDVIKLSEDNVRNEFKLSACIEEYGVFLVRQDQPAFYKARDFFPRQQRQKTDRVRTRQLFFGGSEQLRSRRNSTRHRRDQPLLHRQISTSIERLAFRSGATHPTALVSSQQ